MELSDEELDQVVGGDRRIIVYPITGNGPYANVSYKNCTCGNPDWATDMNGYTYCRNCNSGSRS